MNIKKTIGLGRMAQFNAEYDSEESTWKVLMMAGLGLLIAFGVLFGCYEIFTVIVKFIWHSVVWLWNLI